MIIQGRKEQNQVVIKHKTKIYTAVRYFAMEIGLKKKGNEMTGLEKIQKLISGGDVYLAPESKRLFLNERM